MRQVTLRGAQVLVRVDRYETGDLERCLGA